MKKVLLTLSILATVSLHSKAQHFIASFGVEHTWDIPSHVNYVIHNDYYGYEWVHASRTYREGSLFFDVILQRGDVFVELTVRRDGYITRRISREYYPLHDHVCDHHCGYHTTYYRTYYRSCDSHHHHGHNHVAYVYRPYEHSHGHHNHSSHYVHVNNHGKGHGHGYHKGNGHHNGNGLKKHNSHKTSRQHDDHDTYRERRDRYHDSDQNNYREDDHGNGRSKSKGRSGGMYVRGPR